VACPPRVEAALKSIDGVSSVSVSYGGCSACIEATRPITDAEISAVLAAGNYQLKSTESIDACPTPTAEAIQDPWADTTGIDAQIISHGERVSLRDHRPEGKFTVFDFGAPWCGPCHEAAAQLRTELAAQPDLAVRAISLGDDPYESFKLPAAIQHLSGAAGIPWFIVFPPSGRSIYAGDDLDAALAAIAAQRQTSE